MSYGAFKRIAAVLSFAEHDSFLERARARGMTRTALLTQLARRELARPADGDNFEASPNVYGDQPDDAVV